MHWWHTGAGALLRSGVVLTRSHLIVVISLVRHGTVLHRVAMLTLRTTWVLTLGEVSHLLHCECVRYYTDVGDDSRMTYSVLGAAAASSWVQQVASACTFVRGVLAESPGGSWDVLVRIRGRAEQQDGQGNEAAHDRELGRRTWVPAEPLLHS